MKQIIYKRGTVLIINVNFVQTYAFSYKKVWLVCNNLHQTVFSIISSLITIYVIFLIISFLQNIQIQRSKKWKLLKNILQNKYDMKRKYKWEKRENEFVFVLTKVLTKLHKIITQTAAGCLLSKANSSLCVNV